MLTGPLTAAALFLLQAQGIAAPPDRGLLPTDLAKIERVGEVVPSPDGGLLAMVRIRPKENSRHSMRSFMDGLDRADVLLFDSTSGRAVYRTDGERDGSGFFMPTWSPDGRRLALLSTRGGNGVTLWIWERTAADLRQYTSRSVEFSRPLWISDLHLLCAAPLEGRTPVPFHLETAFAETIPGEWQKAVSSSGATSSLLDTRGTSDRVDGRLEGELLRVDLSTSTVTVVGGGAYSSFALSPDRQYVASTRAAAVLLPGSGDQPLPNVSPVRHALVILRPTGDVVHESLLEGAVPGSVAWSPDSSRLLLSVYQTPAAAAELALVERSGSQFSLSRINSQEDVVPATTLWVGRNTLVGARRVPGGGLSWFWQDEREGRLFSSLLPTEPARLLPVAGRRVLAVAQDSLWTIDLDRRERTVLAPHRTGTQIVWPTSDRSRPVDVLVRRLPDEHLEILTLDSRQTVTLPSGGGAFSSFLPGENVAVFVQSSRDGTHVRMTRPGEAPKVLFQANAFLRDIRDAPTQRIDYVTASGEKAIAWLLRRLTPPASGPPPAVVWVYGGLSYGTTPPDFYLSLNSPGTFNLQLLAAQGFAVLLPSIPLGPESQLREPLASIPGSVMPAIDEAVRLGLIDPTRLAVMGHSFGGYSVYALITQTDRFRAAISLAGAANLVSLYGQFDPRLRHLPDARNRLLSMVFTESGQFRMGRPPWVDMERYIRNSPITYAHQVSTPTLIVQGDLDYVPIQQGEEFYTALFRRGVAARFIRYWGESHTVQSPDNVADLWHHVFQWLDEHVR